MYGWMDGMERLLREGPGVDRGDGSCWRHESPEGRMIMKLSGRIPAVALAAFSLTGCGVAPSAGASVPIGADPKHLGFPAVIREAMDSVTKAPPVPLLAPTDLALAGSASHVSASVHFDRDYYGVNLYALPRAVSVNSPILNDLYPSIYANFGGMGFESAYWAQRDVRAPLPLTGARRHVWLGNEIGGTLYQARGSSVILWHEGRWTIELGDYFTPSPDMALARQMVAYLHTHLLPVPDARGVIMARLHPGGDSNTVEWTRAKVVYWVSSYQSTMTALEMAVSLRPYFAAG